MKERKKGQRLERFVCDYVVLDLETTSTNINDAKIIEIAAIKVKDGVIKERFETLINPGEDIPPSATRINGITDDMVKNAPCLEDVLDDFLAFVEGEVLVGHNITTFDMNILYDAIKDYNGMDFSNDYIDTLYLARKCNDSITNYKLNTICQYYGIDTSGAHRAMNDCYMTEECLKNSEWNMMNMVLLSVVKRNHPQTIIMLNIRKKQRHCNNYKDFLWVLFPMKS